MIKFYSIQKNKLGTNWTLRLNYKCNEIKICYVTIFVIWVRIKSSLSCVSNQRTTIYIYIYIHSLYIKMNENIFFQRENVGLDNIFKKSNSKSAFEMLSHWFYKHKYRNAITIL